jgi:WD40 repeat protein
LSHESAGADASSVDALAWGSDDVLAIARNGEPIVLIDSEGSEFPSLPVEDGLVVAALAFRHDGDRLAASLVTADSERWDPARHQIEVWDWRRGEVVEAVVTPSETVAFDPTGERIATAHPTVESPQIWDLTTGTLEGLNGTDGALDVAWSPDGALIATAGTDGVIRLWDSQSGTHRLALHGHRTSVDKVRFSPDGSKLASVAPDGTLRIWALDLDDLIDLAWGKLSRDFTDSDCQALLRMDECPHP